METRQILRGCGSTYAAGISTPVISGVRPTGSRYAAWREQWSSERRSRPGADVSSCRALNIPARNAFGAPPPEPVPVRAEAY
jgi:hypothetical protein